MLNIGSLVVNSLDYIFIVDKDFRIIYNTRYDEKLNDGDGRNEPPEYFNKNYLEVYPGLDRENSSVIKCIETGEIIINKRQEYYDYLNNRYVTNNVTFPLMRKGKLIAVVELAMDVNESGGESSDDANRKFDEFVLRLKKDAGMITFDTILTENRQMKESIEKAKILATLPNPTLIYGETGTGKELFAQSMIAYCKVPKSKVVIQNCAAVPENLMEAILFGTVRGAYTGAENKKGLFEQADGGVLFLDELNSIPYNVQSKLLRVLQDGTFRPLGSNKDKRVSVKIIGAMNIEPVEAIDNGIIRKDLFYRFSSGLITLPPLRERKEDIALFIKYYVDYYRRAYSKEIDGVDDEVKALFMNYSWDGNVRELSNTIESMVTSLSDGRILTKKQIPKYMLERMDRERSGESAEKASCGIEEKLGMIFKSAGVKTGDRDAFLKNGGEDILRGGTDEKIAYHQVMEAVERRLLENALEMAEGNKTKAGEILGLPRKTLVYRMEKLGIKQ